MISLVGFDCIRHFQLEQLLTVSAGNGPKRQDSQNRYWLYETHKIPVGMNYTLVDDSFKYGYLGVLVMAVSSQNAGLNSVQLKLLMTRKFRTNGRHHAPYREGCR